MQRGPPYVVVAEGRVYRESLRGRFKKYQPTRVWCWYHKPLIVLGYAVSQQTKWCILMIVVILEFVGAARM